MAMAPYFPDTAALEKSKTGEEFIYGGSIGINRILGNLREWSMSSDKIHWSAIFISIYTLFDNNFSETKSKDDTLRDIQTDTRLLCDYLEAYAYMGKKPPRPPVIVFYIPYYDALIPTLRRELSPKQKLKNERFEKIRQLFPTQPQLMGVSPHSERWLLPLDKTSLPHRQLYRWTRSYHSATQVGYYDPNRPHAILTHAALDLHLCRFLTKVTLLERYTGKVKTQGEFGTKFEKENVIPFYSSTHRVFGDDLHVQPLITGKPRTELIKKATDEKWIKFPEESVLTKLSQATGMRVADLASIKF